MTEQEKHLLLVDICSRLPYHTKIDTGVQGISTLDSNWYEINRINLKYNSDALLPYLRSISSLTEEEQTQLGRLIGAASYNMLKGDYSSLRELLEHVYKNHIDLFGLIPMGLALEAPKEMYT